MQQGRKSSGEQGLPDRAAEEQATKSGRKRARKAFPRHNCSKCLYSLMYSLLPRHGVELYIVIDDILEIKRLTAWRTCKWAKSQMCAPSLDHPQHLHP
jgi:hypothetical protein